MSEHDFQSEVLSSLKDLGSDLSSLDKRFSELNSALAERCPARVLEIAVLRKDLDKLETDLNAAFKKIGELKAEIAGLQATVKTAFKTVGLIGSVIGGAVSIGVTLLLKLFGG